MKNSIIYALVLILITISFNSCQSNSSKSPSDKIIVLFNAIKNKDFEKVASMYVTNEGKKLSEDEAKKVEGMFGMASENYDKKGGLENVTIDNETISEDGNTAKVKFTIHYKNGDTDNETMNLDKINGEWLLKITNF